MVSNNSTPPKMMVGTDDFKTLLLNSDVFVDKSLLIKSLLEDSGAIVLITRPRRWGKSLNMDMVRRFLEIEIDEQGNPLPVEQRNNIKLFTGGTIDIGFDETKELQPLQIAAHETILKRLGQFPVLFITFKNLEGESYKEIEVGLKTELYNLFKAHRYLMHSTQLEPDEKEAFAIYLSPDITTEHIKSSLSLLTNLLYKHYNRKVWVLIDEYDTPIINAYSYFGNNETEFKKVLALLDGIMNATFKRGTGGFYLERGFITGIFRIAKSTLFASFNNASEYSLLDEKFATSYGFTQAEVDELLTKVPTKTDPEQIKNWYNGYTFGGEVIYNPWSIMQCLAHKGKLKHYWIDSGGTAFIDKVFLSDAIQADVQELLEGKGIIKQLYKQIALVDIDSNKDIFYSLLLFSGYLNPSLANDNEEDPVYRLTIPNKEVRGIYVEKVLGWLTRKLKWV
ncbi:MAG: AAA family ATPase [Amoebophilaceae bacterium]|nr:AAA family ATPase [Amoebophilaceae bacterium]